MNPARTIFFQLLFLLVVNALFILACAGVLVLCALVAKQLGLKKNAAFAVLKRNFVAYFSNPTGYVFLFLFVALTSFFAFWRNEFWAANLANLDQLTFVLPGIMLIFIPAITMSIWAEERRQGTDELLLTIPADDFDIVVGKYLAAAAVFTFSLLFSQLTSFTVLSLLTLGELDVGLFLTTYLGYWLVGMMMLAVGMVASFLTSNLTVGFILGAIFNAPLVALYWADTFTITADWTRILASFSISGQLEDFSRGVISLSSVSYFVMILLFGIYLSMVLIGRRHWLRRGEMGGLWGLLLFVVLCGVLAMVSAYLLGGSFALQIAAASFSVGVLVLILIIAANDLLGHFLLRAALLLLIAFSANAFFTSCDGRLDATDEQISSLSPETLELMENLDPPHTIYIDAFISNSLPDALAEKRFEIISMLRELRSAAGDKVQVNIHDNLEMSDEQARRAEEEFKIQPVSVRTIDRGEMREVDVLLGTYFQCGPQRVVVPFFSEGVPIEYELIRSVATVANQQRKTIGVLRTDAELSGGLDMQTFQRRQPQLIIAELKKQYDVEDVDPNSPIELGSYDVLLVAQPSSLTQPQLDNLVEAVRAGQPTAIFEDPLPTMLRAPGTSQPKPPRGGMMGMRQPPEQKGDIQQLWDLLGIRMVGEDKFGKLDAHVVWQEYNPYPKVAGLRVVTDQFVFVSPNAPGATEQAINPDNPIVSGLPEVLFFYAGAIERLENAPEDLSFVPLLKTGTRTGVIKYDKLFETDQMGRTRMRLPEQLKRDQERKDKSYVMAAMIEQQLGEDEADEDESVAERGIRVVFVSDIDMLSSNFIQMRAQPDREINFQFENVPFVLNVLDILAAEAAEDDRFVAMQDAKRAAAQATETAADLEKRATAEGDKTVAEHAATVAEQAKNVGEHLATALEHARTQRSESRTALREIKKSRSEATDKARRAAKKKSRTANKAAEAAAKKEAVARGSAEIAAGEAVKAAEEAAKAALEAAAAGDDVADTKKEKDNADGEEAKQPEKELTIAELAQAVEGHAKLAEERTEDAAQDADSAATLRRFSEIRKRRLRYSTLRRVEDQVAEARKDVNKAIETARADSKKAEEDAETDKNNDLEKAQERVKKLNEKYEEDPSSVNPNDLKNAVILLEMQRQNAERLLEDQKEDIKAQLDGDLKELERKLDRDIRGIRMTYKWLAVILPPIPPLLVALIVFVRRWMREREGVGGTRLR